MDPTRLTDDHAVAGGQAERDSRVNALITSHWIPDGSGPLLADATIGGRLRTVAAEVPDRVALVEGQPTPERRRWTFAELLADAERCARRLLQHFEPGERVAVWAHNLPEWVLLEYGTALAGLTLGWMRDGGARRTRQTGKARADAGIRARPVPRADRARAAVVRRRRSDDADRRDGPPGRVAPGPVLVAIDGVRRRPVPEALVRRIEQALGVNFTIVYGQTECSPVLTNTFPSDSAEDKGLTVGPPLPHTEVRIVDPVSLETVPIGTPGELWARGYFTMLRYFDMPEKSAESLRADGWLRTGDLATMDERGYCRIVGRLKDMIIRGGENLFPAEIEEVLYRHPAVAEVAVVGLPDERWGEVVGAFIRPRDPDALPTVAELRSHLRAHCHRRRHPRSGSPWPTTRLTGSGKIQKFAVREAWERGVHAGPELGG